MTMKKLELIKLIENLGDEDNVLEVLQGVEGISQFDVNKVTVDQYKQLLEGNPTIKGYAQSQIDSFVSKGVESFKTNKMPTYIQEAVKKATEPKDLTPEQKQIKELEEKFAQLEKEKLEAEKRVNRQNLIDDCRKYTAEKNYPTQINEMLDFFVGENLQVSKENVDKIANAFNLYGAEIKEQRLTTGAYSPGGGNASNNSSANTLEMQIANAIQGNTFTL